MCSSDLPNELLGSVDLGGLSDVVVPPQESLSPMGDKVVASCALPLVPGALFAKKLCDFLVSLEADDPGSGKTIGCLLKEREMRTKCKKAGSSKEKPFKSKKKIGGKVSAAA